MARNNSIHLVGNSVDKAVLRTTQSGTPVANFRIAVNSSVRKPDGGFEDRLDGYWDVTVWGQQAENVAEVINSKGVRVVVDGRLTLDDWTDSDGNTRYTTKIEAEQVAPSLEFAVAEVTKNPPKSQRSGGTAAPSKADEVATLVKAGVSASEAMKVVYGTEPQPAPGEEELQGLPEAPTNTEQETKPAPKKRAPRKQSAPKAEDGPEEVDF